MVKLLGRASVRPKAQVTVPLAVREALHLNEGDEIEFELDEATGTVKVRGLRVIPTDQAWFWTDEWQAGEREVDEAIARGDVKHFADADSFLASLG